MTLNDHFVVILFSDGYVCVRVSEELTGCLDEVGVATRHSLDMERCTRDVLSGVLDTDGVIRYFLGSVSHCVRAVWELLDV